MLDDNMSTSYQELRELWNDLLMPLAVTIKSMFGSSTPLETNAMASIFGSSSSMLVPLMDSSTPMSSPTSIDSPTLVESSSPMISSTPNDSPASACRLLELATELRLQIYEEVFEPNCSDVTAPEFYPPQRTALLLTSRQIYLESKPLLYTSTTKVDLTEMLGGQVSRRHDELYHFALEWNSKQQSTLKTLPRPPMFHPLLFDNCDMNVASNESCMREILDLISRLPKLRCVQFTYDEGHRGRMAMSLFCHRDRALAELEGCRKKACHWEESSYDEPGGEKVQIWHKKPCPCYSPPGEDVPSYPPVDAVYPLPTGR